MVRLWIFCLNLLLAVSGVAQSHFDSTLAAKRREDFSDSIVYDCWQRKQARTYGRDFQTCLELGLQFNPTESGSIRLQGMPYLKLGDYQSAYYYFDSAVKVNTKEYHYVAYVTLFHLRDYPRALRGLRIFDARTPNFADAVMGDNILYLYGLCYQQMGQLDSALYFLDSLIKPLNYKQLDIMGHKYIFLRGMVNYQLGNYAKAAKDLNTALKIYPNCVECFYYKAKVQMETGANRDSALSNVHNAEKWFLKGLRNKDPYGEYVELPNEVYLSDIRALQEEIKAKKPLSNPEKLKKTIGIQFRKSTQ